MIDQEDRHSRAMRELRDQVTALAERVAKLEALSGERTPVFQEAVPVQGDIPFIEAKRKQSPWSVGGLAAIMSRGAVVSLILLLALILRTLTDSGALGPRPGTLLGIGYATALEAAGLFMYRKKLPLAPIFSISGVLLLVAVVLEAHAGFGSISTVPAYAILAVAGSGMAVISWTQRATIPVGVGTLAVLLAALPLAFPKPDFVPLAVYLLAVNIMAFSAARLPRGWWLRILVYLFTSTLFFLWSFALRSEALRLGAVPGTLAWFFTLVAVFLAYYIGISVYAIWKSDHDTRRPFDNILPTAASAGAYVAALMVVSALGEGLKVLGVSGVLTASALLGIAALKAGRAGAGTKGANTFAFPAALLLALSFRDLSGESVIALAILSWAAISLAWLSARWKSAGVRVTGYFLQGTVLGASGLLLLMSPSGTHFAATLAGMTVIAVVALGHYHIVKTTDPPGDSLYFGRLDRNDVSGAIPLLVSVGAAFLALRAGLYAGLGDGAAFTAGQSLILNLGALGLFMIARKQVDAQIKWVAVLVTVLGGGKAFFYDLFKIKGLPVVASVFSFGMAAAAGSWVLGQWHRLTEKHGIG
ncbi:MAG: hypothetical protein P1S46_08135 [bacterium]|nr:hypothetical protein [bacterium]MDT8367185.1 hypothetical protein [bacterium]